ncbi:MAG: DUF5411 family protein [Bacilli bacterium]|nr:DUF5411 family protein [Bacilli bacterium]
MKDSFWGMTIITLGLIAIAAIFFFQDVTNTSEQNYTVLREVTEAAMYDAVDVTAYKTTGVIRINREKFVENFVRRFSESVSLNNTYKIEIYDISETPPKVSLKVSTKLSTQSLKDLGNSETITFDISNRLDAILEVPY